MRQIRITRSTTDRTEKGLNEYLNDVSKIPQLTPSQELDICKRISAGDTEACELLVKANLRFVISVAKQYHKKGDSLLDLINTGNIGLIKASQRFDHTRGFKFITYAVWWIRQHISQHISDHSKVIRLPLNQTNLLNRYKNVKISLNQYLEREPTISEIADEMDISDEKVKVLEFASVPVAKLDNTLSNGENSSTLLETIDGKYDPTDLKLMKESLKHDLRGILSVLKPQHLEIIMFHFGLYEDSKPMSLLEVSEIVGLTRERVRQIVIISIRKMRRADTKRGVLKSYLG